MAIGPSKEVGAVVLSDWGKALAGSVAALLANAIVYPLDLAKTRIQVQEKAKANEKGEKKYEFTGSYDVLSKLYQQGGIKAWYEGLAGSLLGVVSTNFAYFYWYSFIRSFYVRRFSNGQALSTAIELLLGAAAGALAQLFTIPVSVVTTRQQTVGGGFFVSGKQILADDGIRGLWRGLKASLILVVNPSITYGAAARLRTALFAGKPHLTVAENFLLGAMSKSLATLATQPLIVAKVMQQSSKKFKSFADALIYLVNEEGVNSLFKGIGPQISKGILVQGLLLAFKDKVEAYIITLLIAFNKRTNSSVALK